MFTVFVRHVNPLYHLRCACVHVCDMRMLCVRVRVRVRVCDACVRACVCLTCVFVR